VRAINHLGFLGGGQSEPHLFSCDDDRVWVLKLPGNPQAVQLGQDFLGLCVAELMGVHVPESSVVEVDISAISTMSSPPAWLRPGLALGTVYVQATGAFAAGGNAIAADLPQVALLIVLDSWIETLDRRRPDGAWNLLVRTDTHPTELLVLDFGFALNARYALGPSSIIPEAYPLELTAAVSSNQVAMAIEAAGALEEASVASCVYAVPEEWMDSEAKERTLAFLLERLRRIMSGELIGELERRRQ
jgi:hypothetical protein